MTTREVAIDLSIKNNFQAIPYLGSNLDPAVDTKPQPILPKVVWAINVLATEQGIRSPNFAQEVVTPIPTPANLNSPLYRQVEVIDVAGNTSYMVMDDTLGPGGQRIYYLLTADKNWTKFVSDSVPNALYFPIKHTMFQTRSLVLWTGGDVLDPSWDATNASTDYAFLDFNLVTREVTYHNIDGYMQWGTNWIGVASWGNYMLVYTLERVYYSSPLDFKDFTPATGLGGSLRIAEALGPIQCIVPHSQGFLIYCRKNIVNASYSGDPVAPFILTEVPGSAGLLLFEGEPLVTRNEQSPYQAALTTEGLLFVTANSAEPAPVSLQAVIGLEYTEVKPQGTAKISRYFYPDSSLTLYRYNKVKRLDLFGTKLFVLIGDLAPSGGAEDYNRLLCYDLQSGDTTWIEGDIISVAPNLNLTKSITAGRDYQNKLNTIMESYVITKRVVLAGQAVYRNIILDFMNGTSVANVPSAPYNFRDPEFMISNLSLRRGKLTELWGVKLVGRYSSAEVDEAPDLATLVTVTAYTELDNYSQGYPFIWEPSDRKFVGHLVGSQLRVIVQGKHFDLQEVVFDLSLGGQDG